MSDIRQKYSPALKIARTIEGSITNERIYCLFDNKPVVNLRKHLLTFYNMPFEDYLEFCGLPADYPSVPERTRIMKEQAAQKMAELGVVEMDLPMIPEVTKRTRRQDDRKNA
jgi:predicted transcriptional regulator